MAVAVPVACGLWRVAYDCGLWLVACGVGCGCDCGVRLVVLGVSIGRLIKPQANTIYNIYIIYVRYMIKNIITTRYIISIYKVTRFGKHRA